MVPHRKGEEGQEQVGRRILAMDKWNRELAPWKDLESMKKGPEGAAETQSLPVTDLREGAK